MSIDIIVRGLDRGSGRSKDRLQFRVEATKKASRESMLRELASRIGGLDILRALYDGHVELEELYHTYVKGADALKDLLERKQTPPLSDLMDSYVTSLRGKTKGQTEKYLARFRAYLEDDAGLHDVTADAVEKFVAGLVSKKHGDKRPVSAATKNRVLAAIRGFLSRCVKNGYVTKHPLALVKPYEEDYRAVRHLSPDEYHTYFEALGKDRPALVLPFKVLMHTGADVGEVVPAAMANGKLSEPIRVRDVHFGTLTRLRFKRTKVKKSPERLVPVPADLATALRAHIERGGLEANDFLFPGVTNEQLRYAHQRARKAIGRPDLRRKDLRHVAAIFWRWAGVDLDRIREWLGHSSIMQTVVYAAFGPLDSFDAPNIRRLEAILAERKPAVEREPDQPMEVAA